MKTLPEITQSRLWLERAEPLIPCATQTLAKGPGQYVRGVAPVYLDRGRGARVWDVDGNEYLDFNMAIGPVVLGYAYPAVDEAIRRQLEKGITFSLMHPLEVEVAERLHRMIPNAEAVRFAKTGAEVASAAVRLARAFTGRSRIACCGYHGWHDWYIGTTSRGRGVPPAVSALTRTFRYNDIDSLAAVLDGDTAAVILEPMLFEEPVDDFLFKVRELCSARGALLIFDEMWTGFRLAPGGAQAHFDVKADLAVFSKAIANGMPLAAITGRRDVLGLCDREVFFFSTFGGEALSLAAAKATLDEIEARAVCAALRERGASLMESIDASARRLGLDGVRAVGAPCRSLVRLDIPGVDPLLVKSFVQQELIRHRVLWSGHQVMSFSHDAVDLRQAAEAFDEALGELARVLRRGKLAESLSGTPVQPVFRTTTGR